MSLVCVCLCVYVCASFTYLGVNMKPALSTIYGAGSPLLKLTHGYFHFKTLFCVIFAGERISTPANHRQILSVCVYLLFHLMLLQKRLVKLISTITIMNNAEAPETRSLVIMLFLNIFYRRRITLRAMQPNALTHTHIWKHCQVKSMPRVVTGCGWCIKIFFF